MIRSIAQWFSFVLKAKAERGKKTALLRVEQLENRTVPSTYLWIGPADDSSGPWSNLDSWKIQDNMGGWGTPTAEQGVPNYDDDVTLDGTGRTVNGQTFVRSCSVDADVMVESLTIASTFKNGDSACSLYLSHNLTVLTSMNMAGGNINYGGDLVIGDNDLQASFTWTGGNFRGLGKVKLAGGTCSTMNIEGTGTHWTGRTIVADYSTTINWDGKGKLMVDPLQPDLSMIEVNDGADFTITTTVAASTEGGKISIKSGGTFNFTSTSTQDSPFDSSFRQEGTANISGWLTLKRDTYNSGIINLPWGGYLVFWGDPNHPFEHTFSTAAGAGHIRGSGWAHFQGVIIVDGAAGSAVEVSNVYDQANELDGAADLKVKGSYQWFTSTWSSPGKVIVDANASLRIMDSEDVNVHRMGRSLVNNGTVSWEGLDILATSNADIKNEAGALFDIKLFSGKILEGVNPRTFYNKGTLRKSDGGQVTIEIEYTPNATSFFDEKKGKITLKKVGPVQRGAMNVGPDAAIVFGNSFEWVDGIFNLAGSMEVDGDWTIASGTFTANNNTMTPYPTIAITGNYTQTGGTATETQTTMAVGGDVTLSGGTFAMKYYGTLTATNVMINSNGNFTGVYAMTVNANSFTNAGTLDLTAVSDTPYVAMLAQYDRYGGSTAVFTQTSTGHANLGLASSGVYSVIDVHGTASIAGTLYIWEMNNYVPMMGNQFYVVYADHLSGSPIWDFSHAPLPLYNHWIHGAGSGGGVDYWYIRDWF